MIGQHGIRHVMQQGGLAGARRGDDQAARAFTDRRDDVDDARRVSVGHGFEYEPLIWLNDGEVVELLERGKLFRRLAVDGLDLDKLWAALLWRCGAPFDLEAGTQPVAANDIRRHVDVVRADLVAAGGIAEETESLLADF